MAKEKWEEEKVMTTKDVQTTKKEKDGPDPTVEGDAKPAKPEPSRYNEGE